MYWVRATFKDARYFIPLLFHFKLKLLYANSAEPDQTPHSVASGLVLYSFSMLHKRDEMFLWVNRSLQMTNRTQKGGMYWSKFGSCGGFFVYVCIEKIAFVDYLRTVQKSIMYRTWVCASTSYFDHFCACMCSAYVRRYS